MAILIGISGTDLRIIRDLPAPESPMAVAALFPEVRKTKSHPEISHPHPMLDGVTGT